MNMKKIVKVAAVGALVALAASCAPQKIAVTAHRGFWNCEEAGYAENSIKSLELAQQNGLWGSEFDVHITSDLVMLVHHDPDIDEMRIKLSDKKQSKATNAQIVELTPSLVLDDAKTFKYGYRNVIVVKKMTFPNDKVLTIELSEKQISGRTISLSIDYEDVLSADSFNHILLEEE